MGNGNQRLIQSFDNCQMINDEIGSPNESVYYDCKEDYSPLFSENGKIKLENYQKLTKEHLRLQEEYYRVENDFIEAERRY